MKFIDLYNLINKDTDVDVILNNVRLIKIKCGTCPKDIRFNTESEVKGITAVDYRTIEVQIGGKGK